MRKRSIAKSFIKTGCSALLVICLTACSGSGSKPVEAVKATVAGIAGPTSIGMIQMIDGKMLNEGSYQTEYEIAQAPDMLVGKIINGEIQIAALPTNMAAVLFNKTGGKVQFLAQNTLGVLYIVGPGSSGIGTLSDLNGKKIVMSGSGTLPEYVMNYVFSKSQQVVGIQLEFCPDHPAAAQILLAGDADAAVLPQPFVSLVLGKNSDMKILIDITKEWEKVSSDSVLSMGCLVVNSEFADKNPDYIKEFLRLYEASVNFVNGNPAEAAAMVEKAGIIQNAALVEQAIPYCNIVFAGAQEAKDKINGFLKILYESDPATIGGALPDDSFYYKEP